MGNMSICAGKYQSNKYTSLRAAFFSSQVNYKLTMIFTMHAYSCFGNIKLFAFHQRLAVILMVMWGVKSYLSFLFQWSRDSYVSMYHNRAMHKVRPGCSSWIEISVIRCGTFQFIHCYKLIKSYKTDKNWSGHGLTGSYGLTDN